jgi:hypothetical protein
MNKALKNSLTFFAAAIALLNAPALRAQTLAFNVNLNTATLNSQDSANTPFYLDFQLNYGSGQPTSTVTLSNFQFTGGSASGSPTLIGTASGSLSSGASLTASSSSDLNELYQQFSAATTDIKFTATVSENGSGGTPTEFTAAILDNSLGFPAQLYTTAPDQESLVTLDLSSSATLGSVGGFTSISSADTNTAVTGVGATISVPEPSTTAAILGGAALMLAFYARRSRRLPLACGQSSSPLNTILS